MNATLLCVVLLAPGYGEKDVLQRIGSAGGRVSKGNGGETWVTMSKSTTDADLRELCESSHPVGLDLVATQITDKGLQMVSGLRGLENLDLTGTAVTDAGLRHLESLGRLERLNLVGCPNVTEMFHPHYPSSASLYHGWRAA